MDDDIKILYNGWLHAGEYAPQPKSKGAKESEQCIVVFLNTRRRNRYTVMITHYEIVIGKWYRERPDFIPVIWQYVPKFDKLVPILRRQIMSPYLTIYEPKEVLFSIHSKNSPN